jgi:hypothetical protein
LRSTFSYMGLELVLLNRGACLETIYEHRMGTRFHRGAMILGFCSFNVLDRLVILRRVFNRVYRWLSLEILLMNDDRRETCSVSRKT